MSGLLSFSGFLRNCKILSRLPTPVKNDVLFSSHSAEPEFMEVVNESAQHNVPRGSASHIRVTVVSPLFNNKNLVQRHRLVNAALQEELKGPIHALSIVAVSSSEVTEKEPEKTESPPCRGGSGL
ncbi:unnamed protein product [Larinioides sclopetarius]|uniref:BolA-like protein 1 n=1 Tax=Larinioides sclopetarius TaxID=280406 RepID=A0AAV2APR8_9ARAC